MNCCWVGEKNVELCSGEVKSAMLQCQCQTWVNDSSFRWRRHDNYFRTNINSLLLISTLQIHQKNENHHSCRSLFNGQNNLQTWGLIVLLISKTAGTNGLVAVPEMEQDKCAGVLISQRKLAEVVEMIRTGMCTAYTNKQRNKIYRKLALWILTFFSPSSGSRTKLC